MTIEKINTEMQKNPSDRYTEILGHYLIDRCMDAADDALIGAEGKTLAGAMAAVKSAARKQAVDGVAVMSDDAVFAIVDDYFGLKTDIRAQQKAVGMEPVPALASGDYAPVDLSDFL